MTPRKRAAKKLLELGQRSHEEEAHIYRWLKLWAYLLLSTLTYALFFSALLPDVYARILFWMLITFSISSGQSMDWVPLIRGILRVLIDSMSR
jgi:hypothetical protein